jgi:hypothetical protein
MAALLRRPPIAPVLIAMGVRPRQLPERLFAALEHAERTGSLLRKDLVPLTRADARQLLGSAGDTAQGAAIYEESGGNPFYLEQLARSLVSPTSRALRNDGVSLGGVHVPRSVAAAIVEEIRLVPSDARRLLQGAAVVGDPFELELATAAADLPEVTAIDALNDLLRVDLIRAIDLPRRFRFRHPLVRRTVYEAAAGGWRIAAHERAANALAVSGASAMARAHHVELSAAADAAAHRAPASAERWLRAALRVFPDNAPADERLELLLARSRSLAATGRFTESHTTLVECLSIAPTEASALRLQLTAACAAVEHQCGRHRQAHERLMAALADLADRQGPEEVCCIARSALGREG